MRFAAASSWNRRAWLMAGLAFTLPGAPLWARASEKVLPPLLPDLDRERVIAPQRLAGDFLEVREPAGYKRLDPLLTRRAHHPARIGRTGARGFEVTPLPAPPTAYVVTGRQLGVPAWLLFGVALQESQLLFGHEALPYPWTLDVGGRAERHASYPAVRDALALYLDQGVTNVDCGPMQVNWRAHSALLGSPTHALDPYRNLAVGAWILKQNHAATGDWLKAVGLYHTGSFGSGARRSRAVQYVAGVSRRLSRYGLTLAQAAAITPLEQERRHG